MLPTSICRPISISIFFPDELRTMIVAIESEITPKKQSTIPIAFNLSGTLAFIIRIRPINPITKPSNPIVLSFSLKKSQRKIKETK